jgi:hypothetical protein
MSYLFAILWKDDTEFVQIGLCRGRQAFTDCLDETNSIQEAISLVKEAVLER